MKGIFGLLLLLSYSDLFAQIDTTRDNFKVRIAQILGDLNKDSLPDKVIVSQDTLNEKYRINYKSFSLNLTVISN